MKTYYLAAVAGVVAISVLPISASAAQYGMRVQNNRNQASINNQQIQTGTQLSAGDRATIQRIVEEEKLAGDLYRAFYEKWGTSVFSRIANSEDRHESAALKLATAYGINDPRTSSVGTYTNSDLQAVYDKLYTQGMKSEATALEVARQFESDDIIGLKSAQQATSIQRLDRVFGNLQRASEHHLQEFTNAKNALS